MNKLKNKLSPFYTRLLPVLLLFLLFSGTRFVGDDDIYTQINKNMDLFGRVYKEIALDYVDPVYPDKFMRAGIDGMLSTLDPYTTFIDASRRDEVDLLTTGKYAGIGVTVGERDSAIVITEVMEGYSAQKEGLKVGDKIIEVDGISMTGKAPGDIRTYIKGPAGTTVKMKIDRNGEEMDFVLTREVIDLKNISYKGMLDGGIAYIKLDRFTRNAESEMSDALNEFKSQGQIKGVILDLRDNPGGLLDAAIGILNKFVDKGSLLLTTKGRKEDSEKKYFSTEDPVIGKDIPLVLLVNENTASASEIVSGAIQDLDRGVIIGTRTFGKGLVQVFTPLSYDDQLKITTQKYFTPSGRWIQSKNYFEENKYGVFKPSPYLNQTSFKTLHRRTVYPAGGITPDSVVPGSLNNELLNQLIYQEMYSKFAEKYVNEHPDVNTFTWDDNILTQFRTFLTDQQFHYTSTAETELTKLKNIVDAKNYSEKTRQYIADLDTELKAETLKDFDVSTPEIKDRLEREILRKYDKPEKDINAVKMQDDGQLQTALNVIKDSSLYSYFLSPK
jgi:carboxyl-terminal processing protease